MLLPLSLFCFSELSLFRLPQTSREKIDALQPFINLLLTLQIRSATAVCRGQKLLRYSEATEPNRTNK